MATADKFVTRNGTSSEFVKGDGTLFIGSAPVIITADHTVVDSNLWLINNKAGSACVLTLPAASSWTGRVVNVKTIQAQAVNSASSNVKPIDTNTAGTAIVTGTAGKWATLVSDGTDWVIMATNV